MVRRGGGWFVTVALAAGILIAGAGNAVLIYLLDQPINWIASLATTVVVGGFVALVIFARAERKGKPPEEGAGFDVVERRVR